MGRIYVIIGKSATGKDTVYKEIKARTGDRFEKVIEYTTRPMRENERDGVDYHFTDDRTLETLKNEGKVVECRKYMTVHGPWYYFNVDDGRIDPEHSDYLLISTLEAYGQIRAYYSAERVSPIYIEVSDKTRIHRALEREDRQVVPRYSELCRRFLADEADFSEEEIRKHGITKRYRNEDLKECIDSILADIL